MKKALLIHGTGGSPSSNWLPWLKIELETRGYQVWVPLMPNNQTPDRAVYNDFIFNADWNLEGNLVVGHSSGAVEVLNLLQDDRCPDISTAVIVSSWSDTLKANLNHDGLTRERFINLFPPEGFRFNIIKSHASNFLFFHGDDDPYCPLNQAQWLAKQLGSDIITIEGGGHLNSMAGFSDFPQLINELEARNWL